MKRHRAREFRAFLDKVEQTVHADLDVHVVMDNASSHSDGVDLNPSEKTVKGTLAVEYFPLCGTVRGIPVSHRLSAGYTAYSGGANKRCF